MKCFLIKYRFMAGSEELWQQEMTRFVEALDSDPELGGKISYRCMRNHAGIDCYHLATVTDDEVNKLLVRRDFFVRFTAQARFAAGGSVEVVPLDVLAETQCRL